MLLSWFLQSFRMACLSASAGGADPQNHRFTQVVSRPNAAQSETQLGMIDSKALATKLGCTSTPPEFTTSSARPIQTNRPSGCISMQSFVASACTSLEGTSRTAHPRSSNSIFAEEEGKWCVKSLVDWILRVATWVIDSLKP